MKELEIVNVEQNISNKVNGFMSIFNVILDNLFIQKDYKINAKIILNEFRKKEIDFTKIREFMTTLPEGEWDLKIFGDNIEKLNEIFGISDEEIREYCVINVKQEEMKKLRWELLINSMLEYSASATQFYDALKYNKSELSTARIKLLNEMMKVFKLVKDSSEKSYDLFNEKKFTLGNLKRFNEFRFPIEFLMLRIVYISLHLQEANEEKLEYFAKLLGIERIALSYQIGKKPRYN